MSVKRILGLITSLKTTAVLLCLVGLLLLLNVVLPQASVLGTRAFGELVTGEPWFYFFLVTLGLGRLPTSPLFVTTLVLFFFQLALVLMNRAVPTWRKIRMRPRSEQGLAAWARMEESLVSPLPENWSLATAITTLKGYGYRVKRFGDTTLWGVKHRTAPLGFLLFHLSFFFLLAGGALLYYTRFVGTAVLTEGQDFSGNYKQVLRKPPVGDPPSVEFTLESVDPRFEQNEPTHLGVVLRFREAGSVFEREVRVNHPARWGAVNVLVEKAGLSPVLWLQDGRGYTLDRVAVAATTRGSEPTEVPMDESRYVVLIEPLGADQAFPSREVLPMASLRFRVYRAPSTEEGSSNRGERLFEGALRPGEAAPLGDGRLVLEEIRYWVGIQVVSERGGGLLVVGFLTAVVGLVWRMLLYRRELVLHWDDEVFRLVGRAESNSWRFQAEQLQNIYSTLSQGAQREGVPERVPVELGSLN
jgi:cytochrome c biogenesis protein ResB